MPKKEIDLEFNKVERYLESNLSKEEMFDFLLSLDYPSSINDLLSSDLCTKEVFEYFYDELKDYKNCLVLWLILAHPKCPIEIMKKFSFDLDVSIWSFISSNPNCPMEILNDMFRKIISKFDDEIEKETLFNQYEGILFSILKNQNCSIKLMEDVIKREDFYISKYYELRMKYFKENRNQIESRHKVKRPIEYFEKKYKKEAIKIYYGLLEEIYDNESCSCELKNEIGDLEGRYIEAMFSL